MDQPTADQLIDKVKKHGMTTQGIYKKIIPFILSLVSKDGCPCCGGKLILYEDGSAACPRCDYYRLKADASLVSEDEFEAIGFCETCSYFKQEPGWEPLGKCVFYSSVSPTSNGFACEEYELDDEYAWLDQQEEVCPDCNGEGKHLSENETYHYECASCCGTGKFELAKEGE